MVCSLAFLWLVLRSSELLLGHVEYDLTKRPAGKGGEFKGKYRRIIGILNRKQEF